MLIILVSFIQVVCVRILGIIGVCTLCTCDAFALSRHTCPVRGVCISRASVLCNLVSSGCRLFSSLPIGPLFRIVNFMYKGCVFLYFGEQSVGLVSCGANLLCGRYLGLIGGLC